jgi:hypothetical protein
MRAKEHTRVAETGFRSVSRQVAQTVLSAVPQTFSLLAIFFAPVAWRPPVQKVIL